MYSSDILADTDTVNQNNYYNEKIKSPLNWSVKHTFVVVFRVWYVDPYSDGMK